VSHRYIFVDRDVALLEERLRDRASGRQGHSCDAVPFELCHF